MADQTPGCTDGEDASVDRDALEAEIRAQVAAEVEAELLSQRSVIRNLQRKLEERSRAAKELQDIFTTRDARLRATAPPTTPGTRPAMPSQLSDGSLSMYDSSSRTLGRVSPSLSPTSMASSTRRSPVGHMGSRVSSIASLQTLLERGRSDTAASFRDMPEFGDTDSPGTVATAATATSSPREPPMPSPSPTSSASRGVPGSGSGNGSSRVNGRRKSVRRCGPDEFATANSVWAWGGVPHIEALTMEPTPVFEIPSPIQQASVGADNVLLLSTGGDVYQWDVRRRSRKDRRPTELPKPRWVQALGLDKALRDTRIMAVACGGSHCLALTGRGEVYSWGDGEDGRLGHGDGLHHHRSPRVILSLLGDPIAQIAAGGAHSAAVSVSGSVYTWGRGRNGRLGLGDANDRDQPKVVKALRGKSIVEAACGRSFTCVVSSDGLVWCWGRAREGQCGPDGRGGKTSRTDDIVTPALVSFPQKAPQIVSVACGHSHTLGLTRTGQVMAWGYNQFRQLGFADSHIRGPARVPLSGQMALDDRVVSVECGTFHSVAVTSAGSILLWGRNVSGELGLGDNHEREIPHRLRQPSQIAGVRQIVAGHGYTILVQKTNVDSSRMTDRRSSLMPAALSASQSKQREKRMVDINKKWQRILPRWHDLKSDPQTLALWRSGIPPRLRREVWPRAIGNVVKVTPELFKIYRARAAARMASSGGAEIGLEGSTKLIPRDLRRTIPELKLFDNEGPLYERLLEILEVYASYRPDIGYVQGMTYFAAMLCLHINDQYIVFQCLANLMVKDHIFSFYQCEALKYSKGKQFYEVFDLLLADSNPKLFKLLRKHEVRHSQYLQGWLQTLFVKVLPLNTAARIWDCFFLDGAIFVLKAAVALLNNLGTTILKAADQEVTALVLSFKPAYQDVWDAATNETALFKSIAAVAVPAVVTKKLDRLLNNAFFFRPSRSKAVDPGVQAARVLRMVSAV